MCNCPCLSLRKRARIDVHTCTWIHAQAYKCGFVHRCISTHASMSQHACMWFRPPNLNACLVASLHVGECMRVFMDWWVHARVCIHVCDINLHKAVHLEICTYVHVCPHTAPNRFGKGRVQTRPLIHLSNYQHTETALQRCSPPASL